MTPTALADPAGKACGADMHCLLLLLALAGEVVPPTGGCRPSQAASASRN